MVGFGLGRFKWARVDAGLRFSSWARVDWVESFGILLDSWTGSEAHNNHD